MEEETPPPPPDTEDPKIEPRKIEEFCLAGAANRGIAYIGAIKCLVDHNMLDLKKFVGVSIGSLVGVCYIIGHNMDNLFMEILSQNLSEFQDISFDYVLTKGSILSGEKYRIWVWELLSKYIDPMTNFKDIYNKFGVEVTIAAVSLDSGNSGLEYFSNISHPTMPIYYAIISSMAIPLVFPPVVYNGKRYIDGGILDNFPMDKLSSSAVGLRVSSKQVEADVTNFTYLTKLMQLATDRLCQLRNFEGKAYVVDASDFSTIDFNMSMDSKITLYYRGYNKSLEIVKNIASC